MQLSRVAMVTGFLVGIVTFLGGLWITFFRPDPVIVGFSNLLLGLLFAAYGAFRLSRSFLMYRTLQQEKRREALEDKYRQN